MEYLDIVDEKGQPTGQVVEREYAHRHGIRHRTSHVWLLRRRDDVEILLQKRSLNKDVIYTNMTKMIWLENFFVIRLVPLFIKKSDYEEEK